MAADKTGEDRWRPLADLRLTVRHVFPERRRYVLLGRIGGLIFAPLFFMTPLVSSTLDMRSEGYGSFRSLTLGGVLVGSVLASSTGTRWPKVKM